MLITHDKIYIDASGQTTDALLIRDGRIAAIGEEARAKASAEDERVEPGGACLFPALADAHCHLWGVGMRAGTVDLSDTSSPAEVYARLEQHDADASPSGWVLGYGWDEHDWPKGAQLHRDELDQIFPDTPVSLHRVDRHAIATNSRALELAAVGHDYQPSGGGRAVRDASGRLTGVLVDQAMRPVLDAVPAPTEAEDRQVFINSARRYLSYGVTCTHMALLGVDRLPMLRAMANDGELPVRVYGIVDASDDRLDEVLAAGPQHDPEARLSVRALKFFADGALGSQGALLLEPYKEGGRGLAMTEKNELVREVASVMEDGWQAAVHAIGDAGARHVIEAFEATPARVRSRVRPRLEHAQMLTENDCLRLRDLSAVASIQPIHLRSDGAWADKILADFQLDRLYPWRALAASTVLAGGSDFPIEDPNPWHGIATALTRRTKTGEAFFADKTLLREQILAAYTTGAAWAAHWEKDLGRLDVGYLADVIALDRDPFEATPDQLWDMQVLDVWMGGCADALKG